MVPTNNMILLCDNSVVPAYQKKISNFFHLYPDYYQKLKLTLTLANNHCEFRGKISTCLLCTEEENSTLP